MLGFSVFGPGFEMRPVFLSWCGPISDPEWGGGFIYPHLRMYVIFIFDLHLLHQMSGMSSFFI